MNSAVKVTHRASPLGAQLRAACMGAARAACAGGVRFGRLPPGHRLAAWIASVGLFLFLAAPEAGAQRFAEYELPPTLYSKTEADNAITRLQERIDSGELKLIGTLEEETLRRCLAALGVSPDTQVLVFSKTSLQRNRIHPTTPRALFFSDDIYVGWVPGGMLEIAATDPQLGLVFYRLDLRRSSRPPRFHRDNDCLSCHAGPHTRRWPALMIRSVFPDASGEPIGRAGSFLTDHTSPLAERWGGWYVTGQHGDARHMGNAIAREDGHEVSLDREAGANINRLDAWFPVGRYPRPDSDIVALMVLEHQVTMHNLLAEGALRVRRWLHYQQALQQELGETVSTEPTGTALRVIEGETRRILDGLLFHNEAPLPAGGVSGHPEFPVAFRANRRADTHGRSLKDLDLSTRLSTYRCSYLIYSEAFTGLPAPLKTSVYRALHAGLHDNEPVAPFDHLSPDERVAIREILTATLPEWLR
jgi:hypothetical protein